jgi:hypothetical protein
LSAPFSAKHLCASLYLTKQWRAWLVTGKRKSCGVVPI